MQTHPYTETTRVPRIGEVEVSVIPAFLAEQSEPSSAIYSFSYHITIRNLGLEAVQLVDRHWEIYSGELLHAEVEGPGVVGMQPIIETASTFCYSSSAVIDEPLGYMKGRYGFIDQSGSPFKVNIPTFYLVYPGAVH